MLQGTAVEPYLSVREVVTRNAGYYPKPRDVDAVINLVGLDDKADARVKTLSGGQQRRLDVALGIVGDPQLLFLDEPTTGFDPTARRGAWDLVRALAAEGTTILLTTHYMDEAQNLADRVAVIAHGHIVAEGTPDTIGGRADAAAVIRFHLPPGVGPDRLPVPAELANGAVEVRTTDEVRVLHTLTGWALDNDVALEQLSVDRPTSGGHLHRADRWTREPRRGDGVNTVALSAHQLRYEQKSYWRNPASAFFTFAFPVMFLVIFASLNTNNTVDFLGVSYNQYYVPGIVCFGVISARATRTSP